MKTYRRLTRELRYQIYAFQKTEHPCLEMAEVIDLILSINSIIIFF